MPDYKAKYNHARFLVIRTDRLGDVILATPVLTALKERYPNAGVAMLIKSYTRDLLQMHPHVDQLLIENHKEKNAIKRLRQLLIAIKKNRFDVVLFLHPTLKLALICWLARIPLRIGTRYRVYAFMFNRRIDHHRKKSGRHEVDLNLDLAAAVDARPQKTRFIFHIPKQAKTKIHRLLNPINQNRFIVIHPGSGGSALDWPVENFARLADRIQNDLHLPVVVSGSAAEKHLVDKLAKLTTMPFLRLDGALSIKELAALLAKADLLIANSTGPLHLAAALSTAVVGLYCPLQPCHPHRWGPYGQKAAVLMPNEQNCKKCASCRRHNCMKEINPNKVFEKVKSLTFENVL